MSGHFEASATSSKGQDDRERLTEAFLDEAIVLHLRPYRETSSLVDLFSRERGRLRLLAKGVRRGRRNPSDLAPFARIRYAVGGRGDLRLLTTHERVSAWPRLEGESLYCGFYVAELILRLLPLEDPHPSIYDLSIALLHELAQGSNYEPLLRCFERGLLEELGYGLNLLEDLAGEPIEAGACYRYHPDQGAERMLNAQGGIPGSALIALARGEFNQPADLAWSKRLMRSVLDAHLEGRPLKSRELFQTFVRRHPG
jgi:DNA repair protein RecO (recombination protein O)